MAEIAHADRAHALLSASASHRWLHCTPSARLEATLPDTESDAAKKGTLAHEMAELKLRKHFTDPMGPQKFAAAMKKLRKSPYYEPEAEANTDLYLEYTQSIVHGFATPPYIAIERRVDLAAYVPESFGTADCIIIGNRQLHVIDYKNGKGVPVEAEDNPQMKLYALGLLTAYAMFYPIDTVHLAIVQPRVWDRPSEWSLSAAELLYWGESIKPIAQQAFAGEGEYKPGDHCKFCRAFKKCGAIAEQTEEVSAFAPMRPPLITWELAADILKKSDTIMKWLKALKESALAHALSGGEVPGWKAVAGRGDRKYLDLDAAFAHLQANGIDEAMLYKREPLSPAQMEETLRLEQYRELLEKPGHVIKTPGKPTLAPLSDKREPITRTSAADDFKSEEATTNE